MIRVGPPQGTINDLDLGLPKEFNKDIRKDFEKELKAAKNETKADKKEKPERDYDQVSKKSSGGTKKKMAKADDDESEARKPEEDIKAEAVIQPQAIEQKISNVMVSNEGEVEIADFENNLQQIANGLAPTADTQNIQTQVLTETEAAVTGEATPVETQVQPEFQYMTHAEKQLMAEVDGQQQADPQVISQPVQDAKVEEVAVETASALESKVYDILSKEVAKPVDVKLQQQDVVQVTEKPQALTQTNAVLAQNFAEHDSSNSHGDKESQSDSGSQSSGGAKFDPSNDLAAQVSALHTGQRSFQSHLGQTSGTAGAAATAKPAAETDSSIDANVREVMNQARYLVTAGGGEMTVKMTPEGMGEVNLKVMLDNGKINIEMNAQDKHVKKMLEESLSDLKSSLASHQMRVEHVKINNVTAVDTQNQSQFQSDANSSNSSFQNRQQQEMNFQNFNNSANSNSGRGSRDQGSSTYQNSQQQSVNTPNAKSAQGRAAYIAANKGSSVNMVA